MTTVAPRLSDLLSHTIPAALAPNREKGARLAAGRKGGYTVPEIEGPATAGAAAHDGRAASGSGVTEMHDLEPDGRNGASDACAAANEVATDVTTTVTTALSRVQGCHSLDPHAFLALDGPAFEPCSACGTKPSFYREKWVKGMTERRVLCRSCYGAAVRREQRAGPPLANAIDPGGLRRVTASVGRCDLCGLERAAWSGDGVRLCETCYRREVRWAVESGVDVMAEG